MGKRAATYLRIVLTILGVPGGLAGMIWLWGTLAIAGVGHHSVAEREGALAVAATIAYVGFLLLVPVLIMGFRRTPARIWTVFVLVATLAGVAWTIRDGDRHDRERGEHVLQLERERAAAASLRLPLDPFERAAPGDWSEYRLDARTVVRYEVASVDSRAVSLSVWTKDLATGTRSETRATLSRTGPPTVNELFGNCLISVTGSRSAPVTRQLGGSDLPCVALTVEDARETDTFVFSPVVKGIGLVERRHGSGVILELLGHGTRDGPIWTRPGPLVPDQLPLDPLEDAAVGDWCAYHWSSSSGADVVVLYEIQAVQDDGVTVGFKIGQPPQPLVQQSSWTLSRRGPITWSGLICHDTRATKSVVEDSAVSVGGDQLACKKLTIETPDGPYSIWLSKEVKGIGVAAASGENRPGVVSYALIGHGTKFATLFGKKPD